MSINYADVFPYTSGQSFSDELNARFVAIKNAINADSNAVKYRGAWNAATAYEANDAASYNGGKWLALNDSLNSAPVEGADWTSLGGGGIIAKATTSVYGAVRLSAAPTDATQPIAVSTTQNVGGVLSGNILNPGFSVDMATQAELDNAIATRAAAVHTHTAAQINDFSQAVRDSMEYATGAPVQTLADLRALPAVNRQDKQQRLVEDVGASYRFDLQGTGTDDGAGTIAPDVGAGRWFKASTSGLAAVAMSGAYADLIGTPAVSGLGAIHKIVGANLQLSDSATFYDDIPLSLSSTQAGLQTAIQSKGGAFSNRTVQLNTTQPTAGNNEILNVVGTASSVYNNSPSNVADRVSDGSLTTSWASSGGPPEWLKFDLVAQKQISSYEIYVNSINSRNPKTWQLEVSAMGDFSGEQTVVDSQTNYIFSALNATFVLPQQTTQRFWRLNITANAGPTFTEIFEFRLVSPATSGSISLTVNTPPTVGDVPPIEVAPGDKFVGSSIPFGYSANSTRVDSSGFNNLPATATDVQIALQKIDERIGNTSGAQGPKGDTGAAGPIGPQGIAGAVGPKGDIGAAGTNGVDGAAGPKGDRGDTGAQGIQGPPGAASAGGSALTLLASALLTAGQSAATVDLPIAQTHKHLKIIAKLVKPDNPNGSGTSSSYLKLNGGVVQLLGANDVSASALYCDITIPDYTSTSLNEKSIIFSTVASSATNTQRGRISGATANVTLVQFLVTQVNLVAGTRIDVYGFN